MTAKTNRRRTGSAAVLVLASFTVFLLMAALSIDVGYMQLSRLELRAAADSAAKAGAESLVREDSTSAARTAAITLAAANKVGGSGLVLTNADIQFGRSERQPDGSWSFVADALPLSAVRVTASQPVSLFFGGITGSHSFSTSLQSTASFADNEICVVIDRSHSMCFDLTGNEFSYPPAIATTPDDPVIYPPDPTESRWSYLQQAVVEFVDIIEDRNSSQKIGLVSFGSEIDLSTYEGGLTGRTFPASSTDVSLGDDFAGIRSSVESRGSDVMLGGTNLSAGLQAGIDMLTEPNVTSHAKKTLVVMTDGKWNFGTDPVSLAQTAKSNDITVHTVTFLANADQADMVSVANAGGGRHYHASNGVALVEAFRELAFSLPVTLID
ncbi:TadG family pilus assembly protein [Rubripirellula reticaptiva]|uniref:TadG family pilus assembly protein n=1 Tax=Rubripirellula reticaptiva TaxID=2528013 RepID=UPI001646C23A|nr:TadG family pilus assembly protein [Rubripirellula reticaptiva]